IIYISHELDEVVEIADRCTVLRDGSVAATARRGSFAVADLIGAMTGRVQEVGDIAPREPGPTLLHMQRGHDLPVSVRAGEMIGLAGLLGSGTEAIMRSLFGAWRLDPVIVVAGE